MWLAEELSEAQRLHQARGGQRPNVPPAAATPDADAPVGCRFELRYRSVSPHRCGYVFPCDAEGHVDLDALSACARENYLYARAVVGLDLLAPEVIPLG